MNESTLEGSDKFILNASFVNLVAVMWWVKLQS